MVFNSKITGKECRNIMKINIKLLLIEDNPGDIRIVQELLLLSERIKFQCYVVKSFSEAKTLLNNEHNNYDIILTDLGLPDTKGIDTLYKIQSICKDIPIIVLTGFNDELLGITAVKDGAQDFLIKDDINSSLLRKTIIYSLERVELLREKDDLITTLVEANNKIKTLKSLIPICSNCKKIRDDNGYWEDVELYISDHAGSEFTHGICPDCIQKLYPEYAEKLELMNS